MKTRAFTMIELIMSLAMGLAIVLTIYAGFRQMAEGIKNAEAMALDNDLLNAGIFQALEEVDSWSSMDNPAWQPLRTGSAAYKQLDVMTGNYAADGSDWDELPQPFNHFDETAAASLTADTYYAFYFEPYDKRTWYRGDGGLFYSEDQKYCWESSYGNYSLFANSSDNYVLVGHTDDGEGYDAFLIVPASHRYLGAQHELFKYSLGWYGWLDYLPAHVFVDYYDKYGDYGKLTHDNNGHGNNDDGTDSSNPGNAPFDDTDPTYDDETQSKFKQGSGATVTGIKPWELRDLPDGAAIPDVDGDGTQQVWEAGRHGQFVLQKAVDDSGGTAVPLAKSGAERAVTVGWYLYTSHVGISAPEPGASSAEMTEAAVINRYMGLGYKEEAELISVFNVLLGDLNREEPLVETSPASWPEVDVGVRRYRKWGAITNMCYVRFYNRITNEREELAFPAIGTTFRGARINRGLDSMTVTPVGDANDSNQGQGGGNN